MPPLPDAFLDEYSAEVQARLLDSDIQAEGEALMEEELLGADGLGGTSNERLLQNLAQASKEVIVAKTLKSYEGYAGFSCIL